MKILHIIASAAPETGGPIEGLLQQHAATKGRVEREVVSCDLASDPFIATFPVKLHALGRPHKKTPNPARRFLDHYRYAPDLVPWLEANVDRFDAVIVQGLWNYSTWAAAKVLPKSGVPYFVFTHGQLDPWFKEAYPWKDKVKQLFWWLCEGRLLSQATSVIFTCQEEGRLARNRYAGYQAYKELIVGYGTTEPPRDSEKQIAAFHALMPNVQRRFLLFLSRIHRKKGCDLLVDAFAQVATKYPDIDLVIAGPDQEGRAKILQSSAKALGVSDRIHWPGMLTGDAKWGAFRAAEAFILPSHSENFGIVVAEAMACSTPVLITDKVNIWQEVAASNAGYVETDTLKGVIRLFERWLETPNTDKRLFSERANTGFHQHFHIKTAAMRLVDIIESEAQAMNKNT